MGSYLSIITLNVNGLNAPNQKTKTGWMDTKIRPLCMLLTRDPPQNKGHIQTESEGLEKDISCKWRPKKAEVIILISDKIDFEIKAVERDKEGHYIMIKGSIQEENIAIIDIHAPNISILGTSICKANANKCERGN